MEEQQHRNRVFEQLGMGLNFTIMHIMLVAIAP